MKKIKTPIVAQVANTIESGNKEKHQRAMTLVDSVGIETVILCSISCEYCGDEEKIKDDIDITEARAAIRFDDHGWRINPATGCPLCAHCVSIFHKATKGTCNVRTRTNSARTKQTTRRKGL